jgi:hypothetical protein
MKTQTAIFHQMHPSSGTPYNRCIRINNNIYPGNLILSDPKGRVGTANLGLQLYTLDALMLNMVFHGADHLWETVMNHVIANVNNWGGQASSGVNYSKQISWSK